MSATKRPIGPMVHRLWLLALLVLFLFLAVGSLELLFRIWGEGHYTNVCRDLFSDLYRFDCPNRWVQSFITLLIPPFGLLGAWLAGRGIRRLFRYVVYGQIHGGNQR